MLGLLISWDTFPTKTTTGSDCCCTKVIGHAFFGPEVVVEDCCAALKVLAAIDAKLRGVPQANAQN